MHAAPSAPSPAPALQRCSYYMRAAPISPSSLRCPPHLPLTCMLTRSRCAPFTAAVAVSCSPCAVADSAGTVPSPSTDVNVALAWGTASRSCTQQPGIRKHRDASSLKLFERCTVHALPFADHAPPLPHLQCIPPCPILHIVRGAEAGTNYVEEGAGGRQARLLPRIVGCLAQGPELWIKGQRDAGAIHAHWP